MSFTLNNVTQALVKISAITHPETLIALTKGEENRVKAEKVAAVIESVTGEMPSLPDYSDVERFAYDHFERCEEDGVTLAAFEEDLAALPETAEMLRALLSNPLLNDDYRPALTDAAGAWVLYCTDMLHDALEFRCGLEEGRFCFYGK